MLRGNGRFANPKLMALCDGDDRLDFLFGLAGNKALAPRAATLLNKVRSLHQGNGENARRMGGVPPTATTRAPGPWRIGTCSRPKSWAWATIRALPSRR